MTTVISVKIKWKNKLWIWIFKRNSEISQEKDLSICCVSVDETLHPNFTVIKITQNEMDAAAVIGVACRTEQITLANWDAALNLLY